MGTVTAERHGALLVLQLENPRKANALDLAMLRQLEQHIDAAEVDPSVRAMVVQGTPEGVFSSGADIAEWSPMTPEQFAIEWIEYGNRVFGRFERLRCPTVVAIEGICFGGGLELALCADLRVASPAACLRFPEVSIGAMPGWEGGERLARIAGRGRALETVLTSRVLDAETAYQWGVLNAVWPTHRFREELQAFMAPLLAASPHAAQWSKAAMVSPHNPREFYPRATAAVRASPDAAAGLKAFFAKKPAVF